MTGSILGQIGGRATPQDRPVPGKPMVANNAGGYGFEVDDWGRLTWFLVLGVDAGTYYVDRRDLAYDNAAVVGRCLDVDPIRTVETIVGVSKAGLAPNNDPAIFALAMASAHPEAKRYAWQRLSEVCRTGTHLFQFVQFVKMHRGWGRGLRRAVAAWYEREDVDRLAYQLIKYRQRLGWSHRDVTRLCHPKPPTPTHEALHDFLAGEFNGARPEILNGFDRIQKVSLPGAAAELIRAYRLPWEAVPPHLLAPKVWDALLNTPGALPLGATVRKLGLMTSHRLLTPGSDATRLVVERLNDVEEIRRARLHPVTILNQMLAYRQGVSRGGITWDPCQQVLDALDAAFYLSFQTVEPAGKRTAVCIDVSGSMTWAAVPGVTFNAMTGAAAMAMVTMASEPYTIPLAFNDRMVPAPVSPRRRLDDQIGELERLWSYGRTDCAQPMLWAIDNDAAVDTFVVYTDSETWCGNVHPFQALQRYRDKSGIDARLIVVGMTSTGFTIADPSDPGMLDVVGFSTDTPAVISGFAAGRF